MRSITSSDWFGESSERSGYLVRKSVAACSRDFTSASPHSSRRRTLVYTFCGEVVSFHLNNNRIKVPEFCARCRACPPGIKEFATQLNLDSHYRIFRDSVSLTTKSSYCEYNLVKGLTISSINTLGLTMIESRCIRQVASAEARNSHFMNTRILMSHHSLWCSWLETKAS